MGADHAGRKRSPDPAQLDQGCRAQAASLRRWSRDERVQNIFQYEFRDAPDFPVGLADPGRPYPILSTGCIAACLAGRRLRC